MFWGSLSKHRIEFLKRFTDVTTMFLCLVGSYKIKFSTLRKHLNNFNSKCAKLNPVNKT